MALAGRWLRAGPSSCLRLRDGVPQVACLLFLQIYTDWANHYLAKSGHKRLIKDLQQDVADGVLLAQIIQVVGKSRFMLGVEELQWRPAGVELGEGMEL